ncbi:CYTH and CHAD domain-containing protein [soil metagenome]
MSGMHREIEAKYDAEPDLELPELLGLPGVAAVEQPVEQHLSATYFDTADLRLARGGITLRRRTGGSDDGWHLKLPAAKDERWEVTRALGRSARTVPKQLLDLVLVHSRGHTVAPVARLDTHRIVQRLLEADAGVLAEIADDHVSGEAFDDPITHTSWRELEVELVEGDRELLAAAGEQLLAAGATPAGSANKLARLLGGRIRRTAAPEPPTSRSSAGEVLTAHLVEQVDALAAWDPGARQDAPDALHKMRVATRRLRSALATYRPLLDRDVTEPLRAELKWLGEVLGEPRDAEVMHARLRDLVAAEPVVMVLGPVRRRIDLELRARHRAGHGALLIELRGDRYFRLLDSLDELRAAPPVTDAARDPVGEVLPRLVRRTRKRVLRLARAAADTESETEREHLLHEVRKAAKRYRYAGESVAPALGGKAATFANRMEQLQEVLGEHQDSVVTREVLRELGVHAQLAGENGFSFGRLHGLEQCRGDQAKARYADALAPIANKRPGWLS